MHNYNADTRPFALIQRAISINIAAFGSNSHYLSASEIDKETHQVTIMGQQHEDQYFHCLLNC